MVFEAGPLNEQMVISIKEDAVSGTSLKSLVQGYLLTKQTEGLSPHHIKYCQGIMGRFLWYCDKAEWPDAAGMLTEWHIREFIGYVSSAVGRWDKTGNGSASSSHKASPRTVHHYYSVLRAFFNWGVSEGYLKCSPVAKVKVAKAKPKVIQPYTTEQINKLLAVCDHDLQHNCKLLGARNRAIILTFIGGGVRLSELVGMKIQDIDTKNGWIKILGKGNKERMVRIGSLAQKALWRYFTYRNSARSEVWLTEEGKPINNHGVQSMIVRLKKRAGIQDSGGAHRGRHTYAINFLRVDRNPFNLQYLLGHNSLEMVRRYVSTLGMEDALKAHEKASPADSMGLK